MDLSVTIGSLRLRNPVLVASGTYGYAREALGFDRPELLGGIVPKTVTLAPRRGNRPPRIVETAAGMLNAIGLDNDGVDHFLDHHLPFLASLDSRIVVNVAGKSAAEFGILAERLADRDGVDAVELNLSCPNVAGGTDFATDPALAEEAVAQARRVLRVPIFAKLTPNITRIEPIVRAVESGGADALTLINTVVGTAIDWRNRRPILPTVFGGLSGPAIKPVALRFVVQARSVTRLPIIGVGGISRVEDVMEFLVAGATAVQVGTANFFDPGSASRLVEALSTTLSEAGVHSPNDLIGSLRTS